MITLESLQNKPTSERTVSLEKFIERFLWFYPSLFQSRYDVLHHLFFTIGSEKVKSNGIGYVTFDAYHWESIRRHIQQAVEQNNLEFFKNSTIEDFYFFPLSQRFGRFNPAFDLEEMKKKERKATLLLYKEAFEQIEERKSRCKMVACVKRGLVCDALYPLARDEHTKREHLRFRSFFQIPDTANGQILDAAIDIGVYYLMHTKYALEKQLIQAELKRLRKLRKNCV